MLIEVSAHSISANSCMIGGAFPKALQCVLVSTSRLHRREPIATVGIRCGTLMWAANVPAAGALVHQPLAALVPSLPSAFQRPTLLQREVTQLQDLRHWHAKHSRQSLRPLSTCSAAVAPAPCEPAEKAQVNLNAFCFVNIVWTRVKNLFNFRMHLHFCFLRWRTGQLSA